MDQVYEKGRRKVSEGHINPQTQQNEHIT